VVDLHELLAGPVPEGQPLDLHLRVLVRRRRPVVLHAGPHHQGEGVLVVDRERAIGQLDAGAGPHQSRGPEPLQVGIVAGDPVVLCAGGELDVLAEQVEHAAELARGVVPEGLAWLWKSELIQPSVLTGRARVACNLASRPRATSIVVKTASYSGRG